MTLLILGLVIFMIPHLFGVLAAGAKTRLKSQMGDGPYKGAHALLSIAGFVLIVIGYQLSGADPANIDVYEPIGSSPAAHALLPFSFILLAGANMPSNLKRYVRHPMAIGVMLWAVAHLLANTSGDLASVLLFGAFGLFALLNFVVSKPAPAPPLQPRSKDLMLVVAGLVAYALAMWLHGVFGWPVTG